MKISLQHIRYGDMYGYEVVNKEILNAIYICIYHTFKLFDTVGLHTNTRVRAYVKKKIAYSNILVYPTRCNFTQFMYVWKLLYMFRVVTPPIIRSAYNCIYSIWYLSDRYCYVPL
jgi:hypothetical protein